jgi:hypothetical protein
LRRTNLVTGVTRIVIKDEQSASLELGFGFVFPLPVTARAQLSPLHPAARCTRAEAFAAAKMPSKTKAEYFIIPKVRRRSNRT